MMTSILNTTNTLAPVPHDPENSPLLSVVIPCFNEADMLAELEQRVVSACEKVAPRSYEIVLVNDGSRDRSSSMISEMVARNDAIVGVELARNHGHQIALTAGLSLARGRRILVIDADLQDPPELLPAMMAVMDGGANVVYGRRTGRPRDSKFKIGAAHVFYRLFDKLAEIEMPLDAGDFRLMDRRVLDTLLSMPEQYRFLRGMIAWVGLIQVEFPYSREPRRAGRSKYSLKKMLSLAGDAITGFSIAPLRLAWVLALSFFLGALGLGTYALATSTFSEIAQNGLGIIVLLLAFSSAQLACLGIFGEYLGRTHMQVKNRPLFIVKEIFARRATPRPVEDKDSH